MRTVPAADADELPPDVQGEELLWEETVGPGRYAGKALQRGTRVRFTDLHGDGCLQLQLFNAFAPQERLNVADTAKVQWQAYLGTGSLLLTDMGRVIATVLTDSSGHHDLLCGASFDASSSVGDALPCSRDLLALGVARFGLTRRDVHPCLNLFKGVRVHNGEALRFTGGSGPGATVELRLELPAYVVVANTAHVLDERRPAPVGPVRITAWSGLPAGPDDPARAAGPEARRAFENTEDYLLGHPLAGVRP